MNAAGGPHREAWSNKSSAYADLYTQNVVINMEEKDQQQKQSTEGSAPKERPVWMTQSTVHGAYNDSDGLKTRKSEFHPVYWQNQPWSFMTFNEAECITQETSSIPTHIDILSDSGAHPPLWNLICLQQRSQSELTWNLFDMLF